jgi:hypothetical protein
MRLTALTVVRLIVMVRPLWKLADGKNTTGA